MKLDAKTVARLALPAGKRDLIVFDGQMSGFGFRLRASGGQIRKSWIVQYRRAGRTRRLLLGSAEVLSAEQARAAAKKALGAVATGSDPQAEKVTRRAKELFTLRAVADDYLLAKKANVRARTFVESQRYLCGPYFKPLHPMPIDQITRRDIAARVLAIGRDCGVVTASRARSAISDLYRWAMGEGLAENNPVVGTNRVKMPPSRDRVLDDVELACIWHACGDDDFGKIVRLLIVLGARRTEVGGLRWPEIDLDRGVWVLPKERAKNHREHTLPLPPLALSILESIPRIDNRDCLFGERSKLGFTLWVHAKAALDARLGEQVRPWTLHDLRRTCATGMANLRVQPHLIEVVLNHASGFRSGVGGVYNRSPYQAEVTAALAVWSEHVRALVEGGERKVLPFASAVQATA
jgi:integrase